ncbi:MAG TPA: apolipoprotein N-acyltransferase [Bacteroidia bacterium]|nr:apolipoprotein N-acyltransferase [Bacteroidia bacterium]
MLTAQRNILLSLLSGLLLSAAWYWHLGLLIFFAWVPLLVIEQKLSEVQTGASVRLRLFGLAYLSFFIWNLLVTWWVVYASFGGACLAILANSLLMSFVFMLYSNIKRRIPSVYSNAILIPLWLAWEHAHSLWDLSWTWLNLGNVFAFHHHWVQWYEFTGSSGGTAWVLLVNLLVFKALAKGHKLKWNSRRNLAIAAAILLPMLCSYLLLLNRTPLRNTQRALRTMVVQPNVDPYNIKFVMEYHEQFIKVLDMLKGKLSSDLRYLVLPETFVTDNLNEDMLDESEPIQWFRDSLLRKYPGLRIVSGANTYHFYKNESEQSVTARLDAASGLYYDFYNAALYIDPKHTSVYHKSKLVPGVEKMPFPALFKPLEKLAINMGGTVGSLGLQENRTVFTDSTSNLKIAPVICYESVYSDFISAYVRNGAALIFIITNDGWWEDTPGYKQHLNYARLRAIENRRQIARSANTGLSCFIDEFGNIQQTTTWWKEAVIVQDLYPNTALSFFSRFGDLISYGSVVFSLILLAFNLITGPGIRVLNLTVRKRNKM